MGKLPPCHTEQGKRQLALFVNTPTQVTTTRIIQRQMLHASQTRILPQHHKITAWMIPNIGCCSNWFYHRCCTLARNLLPSPILSIWLSIWSQHPPTNARPYSHQAYINWRIPAAGNLIQISRHSNPISVPRSQAVRAIYRAAAALPLSTQQPKLSALPTPQTTFTQAQGPLEAIN